MQANATKMSTDPGTPLGCDRRLSRAARTILSRHVLPILRHHSNAIGSRSTGSNTPRKRQRALSTSSGASTGPEDPSALWDALLGLLKDDSSHCPLHPENDALRYHELNTLIIENPHHRTTRQSPYRNRYTGPPTLHTCDICGKAFHNQYYLDVHMDQKHYMSFDGTQVQDHPVDGDTNDTATVENKQHNWICPATELCPSLGGMVECQRIALETEPYYGPGSAGLGPDASTVRSEWQKQLLDDAESTCNEEAMASSRSRCQDLFAGCFGHNEALLEDLRAHVCKRLTCQDRLHGLAGSFSSTFHQLREEWDHHHYHHNSFGIWSFLVIFGLAVFYGGIAIGIWGGRNRNRPAVGGGSSILNRSSRRHGTMARMYSGKKKSS